MCGIVGLHLRDPALYPRLGELLTGMLCRSPSAAGLGRRRRLRRPELAPAGPGHGLACSTGDPAAGRRRTRAGVGTARGQVVDRARRCWSTPRPASTPGRRGAERAARRGGDRPRRGRRRPQGRRPPAATWPPSSASRTRRAGRASRTPGWPPSRRSTPADCHPFSVGPDQCLVHNGSFANHATIRRELQAGRRRVRQRERLRGRRPVRRRTSWPRATTWRRRCSCCASASTASTRCWSPRGTASPSSATRSPASRPSSPRPTHWVAMASEYRALAGLPGIEDARIFEPEPEEVYAWHALTVPDSAPVEADEPVVVDLSSAERPRAQRRAAPPRTRRRRTGGRVDAPRGRHSLAVGLDADDRRRRSTGTSATTAPGMNQHATVTVDGNAGVGVAENMMCGHGAGHAATRRSRPGATAHGGLLVIEGDAAARCGISMKGVDIVVGGDVGHMSAFMAPGRPARRLRRRRRRAGRLDLRGADLRARHGRVPRRRLRREGDARRAPRPSSAELLDGRRVRRATRRSSAATARPARSTTSTSTTRLRALLRSTSMTDGPIRLCANPRPSTAPPSPRSSAPPRPAIYDIRGWGAKRALPHFDDLLFLGAIMSRYPLEGYRERCDTDVVLGDRHATVPLHLDIPVTIAGMSFGALSGAAPRRRSAAAPARSARRRPPATAA